MIRRSTFILIAVLILAVGATWYFEWSPAASARLTPTPTTTPKLFEDIQPSSVQKIEFVDDKNETVTLAVGSDNIWQIAEVSGRPVDQGKVAEILDGIMSLTPLSAITTSLSTDATGLSAPTYKITITTSDNKTKTLRIGKVTETTSGYYSQIDGTNSIVLVDKYTFDDIVSKFTVSNLTAPTPTPISLTVVPTILDTETPTQQSTPTVTSSLQPEQTPTK